MTNEIVATSLRADKVMAANGLGSTDLSAIDELKRLDTKINQFLPPRYQHCYESVRPASMGSAGLKYGPDGRVAWGEIWTSFCDLALAGGPPHRGRLLEPVCSNAVADQPDRYRAVVDELDRAIRLVADRQLVAGYAPGWVGVPCSTSEEASWLQAAIVAENVSARRRGTVLQLPAGPFFCVEQEIKNVAVALAKVCHYWDGHLSDAEQSIFRGVTLFDAASAAEVAASPGEYVITLALLEERMREAVGLAVDTKRLDSEYGTTFIGTGVFGLGRHLLRKRRNGSLATPGDPYLPRDSTPPARLRGCSEPDKAHGGCPFPEKV